jgi:SAM-dependent methyltransferase
MAEPNAAQVELWNGPAVEGWIAHGEELDAIVAPITMALLHRLAPKPGERILDVGCGAGPTTFLVAERVRPDGEVVGVDISEPLLQQARRRAEGSGAAVSFLIADAQTAALPGPFHAATSRMGVMFFDDPAAAFANLAGALRPGGRLVFACWQGPAENPWIVVPLLTAAGHLTIPMPGAPDEPGPFSLADPDRIRTLLTTAGFEQVDVEPAVTTGPLPEPDRFTEVIISVVPPLAEGMRAADEATRHRVREAVIAALEAHRQPDGVHLPASAWIVSATKG